MAAKEMMDAESVMAAAVVMAEKSLMAVEVPFLSVMIVTAAVFDLLMMVATDTEMMKAFALLIVQQHCFHSLFGHLFWLRAFAKWRTKC